MHFHQYVSFAYSIVKREEKIFSYNQQRTPGWNMIFKILKQPKLGHSRNGLFVHEQQTKFEQKLDFLCLF